MTGSPFLMTGSGLAIPRVKPLMLFMPDGVTPFLVLSLKLFKTYILNIKYPVTPSEMLIEKDLTRGEWKRTPS